MGLSFADLQNLWVSQGGNANYAPTMAAIALAESGGNPTSVNPNDNGGKQSSFGLWQISTGTHAPPDPNWQDPGTNARLAIAKFNARGLRPWGTWTNGSAKAVLAQHQSDLPVITAIAPPSMSPGAPGSPIAGPPAPGEPGSGQTAGATGQGYDEGVLFTLPLGIGSVSRRSMRKVLGGGVLISAGIVTLAGLFLLSGRKAPGVVGLAQTAIQQRGTTRRASQASFIREEGRNQRASERAAEKRSRTSVDPEIAYGSGFGE